MNMFVSDYDGTFDITESDIKTNIEYVKKYRNDNNIFVFATGRSYSDFMKVKQKYNLEYDYLILNHGALIMDNKDNVIKYNLIDDFVVKDLEKYLKLDRSISHFCCNLLTDRTNLNDSNLMKINAKYIDINLLKNIKSSILSKYKNNLNVFISSTGTLEIVSKDSNKYNAIKLLQNILKVKKIYTIGNDDSDILMIQKYNGFSINNTIDELSSYKKYKSVHELIKDIMEGSK